jgi:hypothetical protein
MLVERVMSLWKNNIVTCIYIVSNDLVKTFPRTQTRATIGCLLLGNGSVNTPP